MTKKQIYRLAAERLAANTDMFARGYLVYGSLGCCTAIARAANTRYFSEGFGASIKFSSMYEPKSNRELYWMDCPDLNSAQQRNMRVLAMLFMAEME